MKLQVEGVTMGWLIIAAVVIAVPVILFPAAYVWHINIGRIYAAIKAARARRRAKAIAKDNVKKPDLRRRII